MDKSNNKDIIGEINTRGNFIEKSRTAIGELYSKKGKKDNSKVIFRNKKNDYEVPFSTRLTNYLIIAGVLVLIFIILIIAL